MTELYEARRILELERELAKWKQYYTDEEKERKLEVAYWKRKFLQSEEENIKLQDRAKPVEDLGVLCAEGIKNSNKFLGVEEEVDLEKGIREHKTYNDGA